MDLYLDPLLKKTGSVSDHRKNDPDSDIRKLDKEFGKFESKFEDTIAEIEEQDKLRNLFTLEERPVSLMD